MENRYTSLELSKKLAENGCKLESSIVYINGNLCHIRQDRLYNQIPAYDILYDICVKYAKDFFGEHYLEHTSRIFQFISTTNCNAQMKTMLEDSMDIVENYILTNCKFNRVKKEATNAKT